jgi:methylated-DNA-[protein]-cysteine S-methyltransferase
MTSAAATTDLRRGYAAIVPTPFGAIGIRVALGMVTELVYLPPAFAAHAFRERAAVRAAHQVERYLVDPDFQFDLPLAPVGTPFQQRVWHLIGDIPRGQVRSYGGLARLLRTSPRAVGGACGANWYPLVVPCHRVVAAQGLGGFAGTRSGAGGEIGEPFQIQAKRWLLRHEGVAPEPDSVARA